MGINRKSGRNMKKIRITKKSGLVEGQPIQICYKMTRQRPCKNMDSPNSELWKANLAKKRKNYNKTNYCRHPILHTYFILGMLHYQYLQARA
jgi:hypothetical protein